MGFAGRSPMASASLSVEINGALIHMSMLGDSSYNWFAKLATLRNLAEAKAPSDELSV